MTFTCNSTTAVTNWYTDAACTTPGRDTYGSPVPPPVVFYDDVGVCRSDSWKSTCRDETYVVVAEYNDSACTTKQRDRKVFVECTASGNATTPASQKIILGDVFTASRYSSSDCTGDATETTTLASCGNCTDVAGSYVMWDSTTGSQSSASPMRAEVEFFEQ